MSTIRPELKRLHSPDIFDLKNPAIDQAAPFCVLVQAMFGPEGVNGEESFDVLVCNPRWVDRRASEGAFSGQHHLIISEFNAANIELFLIEKAKECEAATWDEVARKLGRIGKWEFEDYSE